LVGVKHGEKSMAKGIARIKDGWAVQDSAIVLFPDGKEMEMPEDRYRKAEHTPAFEELPFRDE
jgi:hypothetical protein